MAATLFVLVLLAGAAGAAVWARARLVHSLPVMEGQLAVSGLTAAVTIERDSFAVPTVRASDRPDAGFALGFLHAQERFFQMDILRRRAAGELAALVGESAVALDREARLHAFRPLARRVVASLPPGDREILEAYVAGVNAGLGALRSPPFEYALLRSSPSAWRAEDTILVLYAMFLVLNDESMQRENSLGLLHDLLPEELASFLAPPGCEWDAPLEGVALATPPVPGPETYDTRRAMTCAGVEFARASRADQAASVTGSNVWAVSGAHTSWGGAIVANDMHLDLAVPNTWYRARMRWPADDGCGEHDVTGVTLPGTPGFVAGSNGRVAWGLSNGYIDCLDLVLLERDAADSSRYRTPDGWRSFTRRREVIEVRGASAETLDVPETIWGPVVDVDHAGRWRACRWTAHDPAAVNLRLLDLEHAGSVAAALDVANRCGIPPQNFVCGDRDGHVGWTIAGRIPRRAGDGSLPASWADGAHAWNGWLSPRETPRVVDPPSGVVWAANARAVSGEELALLGDGGYALGARASQIRDALLSTGKTMERDQLRLQLDDRALLLQRWHDELLDLLTPGVVAARPERARFRELVAATWTGRASVESVSYRLVRAWRFRVFDLVYGTLTAPCFEADDRFRAADLRQWEGPLWRMVTERPANLTPPPFADWSDALIAAADSTIAALQQRGADLADRTWGERNTIVIRHPLSRAVPWLGRWLDMAPRALPGDVDMPRVQTLVHGASERFAVSPGHEAKSVFHMPCGESGNPLSPHYRDGQDAWADGRPTPFLPGETMWTLVVAPR